MKADIFLKIEGIQGESIDAKHKGEIEIMDAHWGMSQRVHFDSGDIGCAAKSEIKPLRITKQIERASPALHAQTCVGKVYDTVVLTKRKAGQVPLEFLKITFKKVIVCDISISLGAADHDIETITLNFAEFVEEYIPQNADGGRGAAVTAGYNQIKNVKL